MRMLNKVYSVIFFYETELETRKVVVLIFPLTTKARLLMYVTYRGLLQVILLFVCCHFNEPVVQFKLIFILLCRFLSQFSAC